MKLVLLDTHAIIHRAYHALPDFATSTGEPTGALYGFVSMLIKIAGDLKPDYIVATYDLPKPTYRHEVYENYKAGRAKTDEELISQIKKSREICDALGIPIYDKEGFEADDILGTIVEKLKGNKTIEIVVASGDMDTLQLVDGKKVQVYTLKKGINDTLLYDEEKVNERFGFGPDMIPSYKGLRGDPSDNIIGISGIGEKTATDIIKHFGNINNVYKQIKNKKFVRPDFLKPRILDLLLTQEEEARFSEMLATIRKDAPINFSLPNKVWQESINLEKIQKLFSELQFRNMGTKLDALIGKPKNTNQSLDLKNFDNKKIDELKLALWLLDSNLNNPKIEDIFNFTGTTDINESEKIIFDELKKRECISVFENIEKPLIPIIQEMTNYGVLIDAKYIESLAEQYKKDLKQIEKKVWSLVGMEFNLASPKQLSGILFDKLGIVIKNQKKTAGGAKSTKESELLKMKDMHPSIPLILEWRELAKLISTYLEPIGSMLDKNSRLHADFVQTGTTTGRMSSENPNLQNIPVSSERGMLIRNAFISPKGNKLLAIDYSQIELRIVAFLSGDKKLIDIFKEGEDVHFAVAKQIFNTENIDKEMRRKAKVINFGILYGMGVNALQENLKTDRKSAQNFLSNYFASFSGVLNYINNIKKEAEENGYTKTFFGRRRYFEGINSKIPFIKAAAERMAVNAPIQGTQADIIKIAMQRIDNFLKKEDLNKKVHLIMQIHDELIFEVEESVLSGVAIKIKEIMENVLEREDTKGVPIVANISTGYNWGDLK